MSIQPASPQRLLIPASLISPLLVSLDKLRKARVIHRLVPPTLLTCKLTTPAIQTIGLRSVLLPITLSNARLYIALSFGFSLAVNAWIFFRVSGGLFNPAVSLGMVLVGALTPIRGILLTVSQILGGITGAAIIQAITPGTLNVRTTLGGGATVAQGFFIEMFLTSL